MEEVITPREAAALLRIHVKTLYRLAEEGLVPGKKIGRSWRFRRSTILELLSRNEVQERNASSRREKND